MPKSRANGEHSRRAILDRALALASAGGRSSASIAALADGLGMSKSGVFAHFGSADALDVAMVEAAATRFCAAVVGPSAAAPPGLARLAALCEGFLVYATSNAGPPITPGHRAFAQGIGEAARVRRQAWADTWRQAIAVCATEAVAQGEFAAGCDAAQVAFEITALLEGAAWLLEQGPRDEGTRRARAALDRALLAWAAA